MCIAFLMKHRGMKLLQAYNHLKDVRPQIRPNPGFFEQVIILTINLSCRAPSQTFEVLFKYS